MGMSIGGGSRPAFYAIGDPSVTALVQGGGGVLASDAAIANGGFTVGGSWSPEPTSNLPILYSSSQNLGYGGGQIGSVTTSGTLPNGLTVDPNYQAALALLMSGQAPALLGATPGDVPGQPDGRSEEPLETRDSRPERPGARRDAAAADRAGAAEDAGTAEDAGAADEASAEAPRTVTVVNGDSLSKIAAAHGITWQELYEIPGNREKIGDDPNLIHAGLELELP